MASGNTGHGAREATTPGPGVRWWVLSPGGRQWGRVGSDLHLLWGS